MKEPENNDLERFIHEQLQKLPEREAPEDLVSNVLATIAKQERRPWWQLPFTHWPKGAQLVLLTALGGLLAGLAYVVSGPAEQVSFSAVQERAISFAWIGNLLKMLGEVFVSTVRESAYLWLAGAAAVVCMMYLACVAGGVALWRIATTHSLRQP